jgi:hypothetical protein
MVDDGCFLLAQFPLPDHVPACFDPLAIAEAKILTHRENMVVDLDRNTGGKAALLWWPFRSSMVSQ